MHKVWSGGESATSGSSLLCQAGIAVATLARHMSLTSTRLMAIKTIATAVFWSACLALPLGAQRSPAIYTGSLTPNQQLAHDIYKELIEINTGIRSAT